MEHEPLFLKERIRHLEEESRRKDHLLAAALERIPAIEPPAEVSPEAREATVSASEERNEGRESAEREKVKVQQSWWKRWLVVES